MTNARERAIKMYWKLAKEKCPFQTEEIENGYLEGFIDCAELFEEEDKLTLTKYARTIIDEKDECIEELEKENAELKKQQFSLRNERDAFLAQNEQYEKDLIDFNENLNKATEIIKDQKGLLDSVLSGVETLSDFAKNTLRKAEQFLNSEE